MDVSKKKKPKCWENVNKKKYITLHFTQKWPVMISNDVYLFETPRFRSSNRPDKSDQ